MKLSELKEEPDTKPDVCCTTLVRVKDRDGVTTLVPVAPPGNSRRPDAHLGAREEEEDWGYDYGQMFY